MDVKNDKGKRSRSHSTAAKPTKDPELEAEIFFAKENGIEPPRVLPSDAAKKIVEAFGEHYIDKNLFKNLKNGRAERKARSRGVSGCSIKKDGGRFEYGLDCVDLAYDNDDLSCKSSTDTDDELVEYADFVCKYSVDEIRAIFGDYLQSGNMADAMDSLEKFCITGETVFRMLKDLMLIALEQANGSLELAAKLIGGMLSLKWVSLQSLIDAIEDIVGSVDDLSKDVPKLGETLAVFIAKLIEQNIVPSNVVSFLASKNLDGNESVKNIFADAFAFANNRHLLNGKCVPSGGHQSLDVLSAQFKLILEEYVQSNDEETAELRLSELKVPHFNHEFVYQAGILALEQMHDHVMSNLAALIKAMSDNGTLLDSCIVKGFTRLYAVLADLYLDLPAAYALAQLWVQKSLSAGYISNELAFDCPSGTVRSRSRTLSQGPNGKLSCLEEDQKQQKDGAPSVVNDFGPRPDGTIVEGAKV
uniref:Programmed cell death protein 4 n=1 Tax=Globodera rostochiensis TaxID=31243 RepID=A0A914GW95_GLORO